MSLLGYSGGAGDPAAEEIFAERGLEIINQLLLDLGLDEIAGLSDEINKAPYVIDALINGTAMLISLSEADSGKNSVFTQLYAAKRAKALGNVVLTEDKLPSADLG